jgi:hypothetical protein
MPTSFGTNLRFSPKPEKVLEEFTFDGGLKTDFHETKLAPNESPDLANITFNDTGSIKTRNGYLRYSNDEVTAASDQSNTGSSTATVTLDSAGDYAAETFQLGSTKNITQVNLYLAMTNANEEQYVRAEIWSTSTTPSAMLTQSQILLVSGTSETTYKFRFREPYSLTGSTSYAIVVKPFVRGSTSATVKSFVVHRTGNVYGSGAAYTSTDAGVTWSAISSADLKFDVLTSTTNLGSTGLIRYYNSTGVQQLFAKFGTSLYRGNDNTGALTAITLGSGVSLTSANFIDWTIDNDTLLVVDGTNKIQKYSGSTNSNYSTGTITATNASATVTGSGTSWNTVTNAIAGEYIQMPDGKWYKITAIASDTSLTIEVSYQGSTLSGQTYNISPWGEVQGRLDSTAPSGLVRPTGSFIANHINRIWVLQNNALYFSTLDTTVSGEHFNDFDTSNNAGQINIPAGKGDNGTGLYSINGSLYVFQRNAIWVLLGSSPANFELRNVSNEIGLIDKRTIVEYDAYLIFYSGKDIYIFDGSNLKNLTANRVNTTISEFGSKTNPAATLWGSTYILSFTVSGGSYNSKSIFYDIVNDKFGIHEGVFASAWSNWNGGTDNGEVYFASSNQGTIYKWDTGGHDDGYEIETRYNTPSLGLGVNMNDKVIKKVYLQQIGLGDWDLTVNQIADITGDTTISTINLLAGSTSLWDVAVWDVDVWSDEASLITTRINEFQGTGKYFKYEFSQIGYNEGVEILGLNVTTRVRKLN